MPVAGLVLLALACGETAASSPAPSRGAPSPGAPAEPEPAAPAVAVAEPVAPVAPPSIERDEVDALIARWLDAQNRGDFEAYQALYAARFTWVRRTARIVLQLDRAGWMEDRRRLFARPMEVAASDVEVASTPTTAIARFTQRWSSGRYTEEGPKRMVLVREAGVLRIAAEEMIAARPIVASRDAANVLPALSLDAGTLIVLGDAPGPSGGAPRLVSSSPLHIALADDPAPSELQGRTVQLIGDRGVCTATVESLAIAAVVIPHFGTVQQWNGEDFDDATPPVITPPAQIAQEVVRMAEHHHRTAVVGPSTCGVVHAAVLGERAPQIWPAHARAETEAAVAAHLFTGALLRELVAELREAGERASVDGEALEAELRGALRVREYALDPAVGVIEARISFPGECGGHERAFFFTRSGDRITPRELPGWHTFESVFDVEGDGPPELAVSDALGGTRGIVRLGATAQTLVQWSLSNLDCGC